MKTLGELLIALKSPPATDDALFRELVDDSVYHLNISDKELAREFGVSRPTVTRWRNGANAPHPAMRKHVFAFLEKRVRSFQKRHATNPGVSGSTLALPVAAHKV